MAARISVIIPVYNAEKRLGGCLESVIGQTEKSLEILCINDGSTDGSGGILDNYAKRDDRVRVLPTENRGVWKARNEGIDRAEGEYVVFCDADDTVPPKAYEILADAADTGFDVVIGGNSFVDGNGTKYTGWHCPQKTDAANFQHCSTVWERICRRDFLNRNCLRFDEYLLGEDQIFVLKCYLANPRWRIIDEIVYNYYFYRQETDKESLTNLTGLKYFKEHLRCRIDLVDLAREHKISDSDTLLFFGSAGALREQLLRIRDGCEAEAAMVLFKQYLASLPWDECQGEFERHMQIPKERFYSLTALEYNLHCADMKSREPDPAVRFREGEAGLRKLTECAAAWLEYKLRRKGGAFNAKDA